MTVRERLEELQRCLLAQGVQNFACCTDGEQDWVEVRGGKRHQYYRVEYSSTIGRWRVFMPEGQIVLQYYWVDDCATLAALLETLVNFDAAV